MEPQDYNNHRPPCPPPPPQGTGQSHPYGGKSQYGAPYQDPRFRQTPCQGEPQWQGHGFRPQQGQWREPAMLPQQQTNGMGIAGFVLSLIAFFGCALPYASGPLWLLGLIFSIIGLNRQPRGLAIAGLVISLLGIAVILAVIFFVGMAAATGELRGLGEFI